MRKVLHLLLFNCINVIKVNLMRFMNDILLKYKYEEFEWMLLLLPFSTRDLSLLVNA